MLFTVVLLEGSFLITGCVAFFFVLTIDGSTFTFFVFDDGTGENGRFCGGGGEWRTMGSDGTVGPCSL